MRARNRRALGTRAPVGPLCYALGILALFDPMPNEAGEGGGVGIVGVESIFIVSDPSSGFDSTIPLLSPPDFGLSVIETQRG